MSTQKYRRAGKSIERKKKRPVVLIIEDDDELNETICDCLSEAGFECVQALSGNEGMEYLKEEAPPALIVIDGMIEDVNGFQCCAYVKLAPETNTVPVLMLLDRPIEEVRLEGLRVEAEQYIVQPLTPEALATTALELLKRSRHRVQSGVRYQIALTLQSNLKLLDNVNVVLNRALKLAPLDDVEEQKIKYVTQEMGRNAIEWGNQNSPDNKVRLTLCLEKDRFWASVADEGEGFDPTHVPHAADPENPIAHFDVRQKLGMRDGGFGILVAREFMDEVKYNDKGNEVVLVKRLSQRAAAT